MLILSLIFACVEDEKVDSFTSVEDLDSDGYTIGEGDCNDQDPNVSPSAPDVFGDSIDQNCDGADGVDGDGDGFAGVSTGGTDCDDTNPDVYDVDKDGDGESMCDGDCDDLDGLLNHWDQDTDGQSSCDGDCDDTNPFIFVGAAPEDDITLCMKDRDGDGFGDANLEIDGIDLGTDCDDEDALLNGKDFDADGQSSCSGDCNDFDPTAYSGAALLDSLSDCMRDIDGDGYGDQLALPPVVAGTDCDDTQSELNPEDIDVDGYSTCDGDCDDSNPHYQLVDLDGDGFSTCDGDCDDEKIFIFPGAAELDSQTQCMKDQDYDGYGDENYIRPGTDCDDTSNQLKPIDNDGDGFSTCQDDCDDTNSAIYPGSAYIDFPSDCILDFDGDGYASIVLNGTDCNDFDNNVNPFQIDVVGDNLDANCDGHDGDDSDGDSQASVASGGVDCNDGDILVHDLDLDGDGLGICSGDCDDALAGMNRADLDGDGVTTCDGDCDDQNIFMYPGAAELDSTTSCLEDVDGDGYGSNTAFNVGSDCDDLDYDQNYFDLDGDGFASCQGDCNDSNPNIFPFTVAGQQVCESPQIEVLVQQGTQQFALGCPEPLSMILTNTGSSDLTISSVSSSDTSVVTVDLVSSIQGALPFIVEESDSRTAFLEPLDLPIGVYPVSVTVESDSVLQSTATIPIEFEVTGTASVQHEVTFTQPSERNFILIPEVLGTQNEREMAMGHFESFASLLVDAGHSGSISILNSTNGCVQLSFPLTQQGIASARSDFEGLTSVGGIGPERFENFLLELNGGCNAGLLNPTDPIAPVFIGLGAETVEQSELDSLSLTTQSWTVQSPILMEDTSGSCSSESHPLLSSWVASNDGQVWELCTAMQTNTYWTSVYEYLETTSGFIPLPQLIWQPGVTVALNNVELSSGWEIESGGLLFNAPPLPGDTVTISFNFVDECQ